MKKWFNWIIIAILFLNLSFYGLDWMARHAKSLPSVPPQAEGYDVLLSAAKQIGKPSGELIDMTPDEIQKLAAQNRPFLTNALKALEHDVKVPLSTSRDWLKEHRQDLKAFNRLAAGFIIENRANNLNGQTNADNALTIIRLGQTLCRGGMVCDAIAGSTVEMLGILTLQEQLPHLDAKQSRKVAQTLEELEAKRENTAAILEIDSTWFTVRHGLVGRMLIRSSEKEKDEFTPRYQKVMATTRRAMIRAANQACQLETGKAPANLQELVPNYLKAIPLSPETGKPMELKTAALTPAQ